MNPFIIKGYHGVNLFCDREQETNSIISALENGRDITLVSLRKMGKTGLIMHVFERLKEDRRFDVVYLDIYHTENLNGLINQLATALYRMKRTVGDHMREFLSKFRFVRPVITIDPLSGLPSISLQVNGEQDARGTLEELFGILNDRSANRPVVVAIDEFQQIAGYPEGNAEALLRGMISTLRNIRFIFSGSNKSMLLRMFGDATRPFYQSSEMMFLSEIPVEQYRSFIIGLFEEKGRQVDVDVITELLRWCRGHTWYVQFTANRLFETGRNIDTENLRNTIREIISGNEPFYLEFRNLLTRHQWQLLRAIASTDGIGKLTSGDFIRRYNLTNASTVKRSVNSLIDKEMVFRKEDKYYVYDVFLARWLEMINQNI